MAARALHAYSAIGSEEEPDGSTGRRWGLLVRSIPILRAYVRRLVQDADAADEVLQEVSLRALVSDAPVEEHGRFVAWCCGVARNVVASDWRTRRRTEELPLPDELHDTSGCIEDPEGHIDGRKALARAIVGLDAAAVELLVRRYVLEETGAELADALAQTPAAIRMRLMRLRSMIRAWAGGVILLIVAA